MERFDAIIIGAGAAGMFCFSLGGEGGGRGLVIDKGKKKGGKNLMCCGGGWKLI
ncbi:FAD-binding protein, partial [Escherichia coli]|uniref:FAD-binding protein n=1 Tax=Escherichia coli TaxID=562 RepID=UPI000E1CFA85